MSRPRIAVWPAQERNRFKGLFDALEQAFEVTVVGEDAAAEPVDAVFAFASAEHELPARLSGTRMLVFDWGGEPAEPADGPIRLSGSAALDARLRGRALPDEETRTGPGSASADGEVLASRGRQALWTRSGAVDRCHAELVELEEGESLRDHLRAGRFLALLPLVCLLREMRQRDSWTRPPMRASFILDDPNLHSASYGYVRYPQLVESAGRHDYHAVMAMIPIDAWFASRRATRIFLTHGDRLSLAIHGARHLRAELAKAQDPVAVDRMLAGALRRVGGFERRTGLRPDRVMVPPHGGCSRATVEGLLRLGFEAMSITRSFPWVAKRIGESPYRHPPPWRPLTGFLPGELSLGAFPVLLRQPFSGPSADLVFRAFLDQPLVVAGHHEDLAAGLDRLESAASFINGLGEVTWTSLSGLARRSLELRRDSNVLFVRPYSRTVRASIAPGVTEVRIVADWVTPADRIEVPAGASEPKPPVEIDQADRVIAVGDPTRERPVDLTIRLLPPERRDPAGVEADGRLPFGAVLRRSVTESRDRLQPLLRPRSR